jgi:protein involved in polysaccharide export with SLBB domain
MTRAVRRILLAGLLVGLCMVGAPAVVPAQAAEPFVIGPGDKISINVHQRPDLSGEFRVLPGGALSLPFIGSLPVAGLSIEEIRDKVAQRLRQDAALLDPRVSVQIAELQPILVAGVVRRPGQYPFQLGMTVGHAVAIAGGTRRVDPEEIGGRIEIARLRELLRQSQDGLGVALIARARLAAEAQGADDFELPPDAARYLTPDRLRQSYDAEREIMRRRTAAYTILRVRSSPQQRIEANADTALLPGDLVEVSSGDPEQGRRLAADAPR